MKELDSNVGNIDPVYELIGRITIVKLNNRSFAARLVAVRDSGEELRFESKSGSRWMVRRSTVKGISQTKNRPEAI